MGVGLFLLADLLTVRKSASKCLLYQMASLNNVFLYLSTFKHMYTVPNAKSVSFTEISNSYLGCYNNVGGWGGGQSSFVVHANFFNFKIVPEPLVSEFGGSIIFCCPC